MCIGVNISETLQQLETMQKRESSFLFPQFRPGWRWRNESYEVSCGGWDILLRRSNIHSNSALPPQETPVCIPCRVITHKQILGSFCRQGVIIISLIKTDQLPGTRYPYYFLHRILEEIKTEKERRCFSLKSAARSEEPSWVLRNDGYLHEVTELQSAGSYRPPPSPPPKTD